MLTKEEKKKFVKRLREKIKRNKLAVFCSFDRVSSERQRELKKGFEKIGGEIFVVKRRLLQRALTEEEIQFSEILGPVMIALASDEILPAKIIKKFPQKKERLDFIGGISREDREYSILNKTDLEELAILPTREEILANSVGTLRAPILNLYFVLKGNIQKFNYILANIREE